VLSSYSLLSCWREVSMANEMPSRVFLPVLAHRAMWCGKCRVYLLRLEKCTNGGGREKVVFYVGALSCIV